MARTRYQAATSALPLRDLPAAALRAVWREGYRGADLRADVLAGAVVGIVALPLAMALAIAVGVAPQHGLYTAIVAGAVIAALGGSRTQVSGPTAAFIVILAPIYTRFGLAGLLTAGALGGLMLIGMGLARFGRFIEFIPHPVTTGFTAGIATVIATLQLKDVLGLKLAGNPGHFLDRVHAMIAARSTASAWELLVGAGTLALLLGLRPVLKLVPPALIALPVAAVAALLLERFVPGLALDTISRRFHYVADGVTHPGIPRLPPLPMLPWNAAGPDGHPFVLSFATLRDLLPSAFTIAMLGAIESLLSAVVADGMASTKHDPDSELIAQGVGNVIAPFFGGIPATGAIARTATNVRSGARSPIASVVHATVVLAAVIVLAPLVGYLPMSSLAALLLLVAWNMSELKHFAHIVRVAPRSDVMVLLTCFGLTVFFDMVLAVSVGIVLAALLFMRRMAEVTRAQLASPSALPGLSEPVPAGVAVYDVAGPLFFGAAQRAMATLVSVGRSARATIIRMDQVPVMDATGLVALESALGALTRHGGVALLVGLQPQPRALLERAGIGRPGGRVRLCATIGEAVTAAG